MVEDWFDTPRPADLAQAHVEQRQPTIFLDMDGVLADFDAGAGEALGTDNTYKWEWLHGSSEFWRILDAVPDFFFNLPPTPDAMLLFGSVRHLNPVVLTALPKTGASIVDDQKRRWAKKFLGDDVRVITCMTSEKPDYCSPGDVLVDDRSVNAGAWMERGGRYVLHTDAKSSVNELQNMGVI
jgi:hypothetical protein